MCKDQMRQLWIEDLCRPEYNSGHACMEIASVKRLFSCAARKLALIYEDDHVAVGLASDLQCPAKLVLCNTCSMTTFVCCLHSRNAQIAHETNSLHVLLTRHACIAILLSQACATV